MMNGNTMITIQGEYIMVNEFKQAHVVPLKDFIKRYSKNEITRFETPPLPNGTIKYARKNGIDYFYIHMPMGYYQFFSFEKKVTVLLPHTMFKFSMKGRVMESHAIIWNFEKEGQFKMSSKKFAQIPMQNIGDDNHICMGPLTGGSNQKEVVENFIKSFFETKFNDHWANGKESYMNQIADDQKQMLKDGLPQSEILQRWYKVYNKKTKKLGKKCWLKKSPWPFPRHMVYPHMEEYKTYNFFVGD